MRCQTIQFWTFIGLVGASLDLAIAFLLLCASFLAFIVSKLLGLFGLCLPCPCNGLFGNAKGTKCFQRTLVNSPMEKISSVQLSVRTRFPFDSLWVQETNLSLLSGRNQENECSSMEDAAPCSSFSDRRNKMGKGAGMQRIRNNRRRCKIARHDLKKSDAHDVAPQASASVNKMRSESNKGCMIYANTEDGMETPVHADFEEESSHDFQLNEPTNEDKPKENNALNYGEPKSNAPVDIAFGGNLIPTVRVLEQQLEEEHNAHAALSLELERERSAAASAADEAMAMILRLQEEKASIEMESRQFHRIMEEKSAYDAEEMNILKEILVRREREKHFLEKEVEAYQEIIFGIEQLDPLMHDSEASQRQGVLSSLYSKNPVLMQQQIKESIQLKEKDKNANLCSGYEVQPIDSKPCTLLLARELPIPEVDEDAVILRSNDEKLRDKGLSSLNNDPYAQEEVQKSDVHLQFNPSDNLKVSALHKRTVDPVFQGVGQIESTSLCEGFVLKTFEDSIKTTAIFPSKDNFGEPVESSRSLESRRDPFVHDVHVIDDKLDKFTKLVNGQLDELSTYSTSPVPKTCDCPIISRFESDSDINRSWSHETSGFPPIISSQGRALLSDMRRNSMSAVDYERFKMDNEVEGLRARLKIVQEGREKLNFSVGSKERKKLQLQLLEDIFCQLHEIRQLTGSKKAGPQTSLAPLSWKGMSKGRRWRSVSSLGVHRST